MKTWDVTTLGSTMLSLSTESGVALQGSEKARLDIAGAESNCAIGLASLGKRVSWMSKVGDTPVGDRILSAIRAHGVDVSGVKRAPGRSELMWVEAGFGTNRTNVIYDRVGAPIESYVIEDVNLGAVKDSTFFHATGITSALSEECHETLRDVISIAHRAGVKISFDVNHRAKLWTPEMARERLSKILPDVDLLIVGEQDLETIWGRSGKSEDELRALQDEHGIENVILTQGSKGASGLFGEEMIHRGAFASEVVSPIGAGDAFAAGVLYSLLEGDVINSLKRGCAMAALARESRSDYVLAGLDALEEKMADEDGKRLSR